MESNTQTGIAWVPIMKACQIASVSRRTIYNWIDSGKLEYARTAGGSIRINPASLWSGTKRLSGKEPIKGLVTLVTEPVKES